MDGLIAIDEPELGQFSLSIKDINDPLWFGKFQTGKLSIYLAVIKDGVPKIPCFGLIYIVTEQDNEGLDGLGYTMYTDKVDKEDAMEHFKALVETTYANMAMQVRDATHASIH